MSTRITLNGTKWGIEKDVYGRFVLLMQNFDKDGFHFSGHSFNTRQELDEYLDEVDERVRNAGAWEPCTTVPANYYGVVGRYYGD